MKVCLTHNVSARQLKGWIAALEKKKLNYSIVDLSKSEWLDQIMNGGFDFIIARPHGSLSYQKQLFDERLFIIKHVLNMPIYPNYESLMVYENKRMLSYWLKANNIPHASTNVFYNYDEALDYISESSFPIVAKSNIGASGSGVHIIKSKSQAERIIRKTFKGSGLPRRKGPNFVRKGVYRRIASKIFDFEFVKNKLRFYKSIQDDRDRRSLILQEYIPHKYEWKNVRIGNSYFSHKKMVVKGKASGGYKMFDKPPATLLNFVKKVTDIRGFESVSVDVLETGIDTYIVNEVQTYFGQPLDYLMSIDGRVGRYLNTNDKWVFEEGMFNTNHSCDLRLEHALELFKKGRL